MQNGTIFDIKKDSINDGPGIRTTVFLSGCPLSRLWCHNPESHSLTPQLLFRAGRCLLCGACIEACPERGDFIGARESVCRFSGHSAWHKSNGKFRFTISPVEEQPSPRLAQQNPEQYRSLIVRVAGYSDYFCDLSTTLQEEIIARTEHEGF